MTSSSSKTVKISEKKLKAAINEGVERALWENKDVQRVVLETRLAQINEALSLDEAEWFKRAKNWLKNKVYGGEMAAKDFVRNKVLVNPNMIDDPSQVSKSLDKDIAKAMSAVTSFKADALRSSQTINSLQTVIHDLFGRYFTLLDNLPPETKGKYEREVMKIVGMFYIALMEEKKRIEVYVSSLAREVSAQGYNLGTAARQLANYRPERGPVVSGGRVVEPEESPETDTPGGFLSPEMAGARA